MMVRVTLLNDQWFDMTVTDGLSVAAWSRCIKADGAIYTTRGTVPWHAIASMIDRDLLEQRGTVLDTMPTEGRPN